MPRGPFFGFRVGFATVAVVCALVLPYSIFANVETTRNGFGATATLANAVIFYGSDRLALDFDFVSPAHLDVNVLSYNVTVSGGNHSIERSGGINDLFERNVARKLYVSIADNVQPLSASQVVSVTFSIEVYAPYREATAWLNGSSAVPLEVMP